MQTNTKALASLAALVVASSGCGLGAEVAESNAAVSTSLVLVANMVSEDEIDLSWSPFSTTNEYELDAGVSPSFSQKVFSGVAGSYAFTPTSLLYPGIFTSLSFQVHSTTDGTTSNWVTVSLVPPAPTFVLLSTSSGWDQLDWQNASHNESQILIERLNNGSIDPSFGVLTIEGGYDGLSTQAPAGSPCRCYEIRESNIWGTSPPRQSNGVSCGTGGGKTPKQAY
jgi:hypothetical protein